MSNPSFSNIDRWLFEYVEGNLSPEQIQQLEAFLLRHPELDVDKDMWELAKVQQPEVVYPDQQKFVRRRPVGLYMAAGFASIAIFAIIGVNLIVSPFYAGNYVVSDLNSEQSIDKNQEISGFKSTKKSNASLSNMTVSENQDTDLSVQPNIDLSLLNTVELNQLSNLVQEANNLTADLLGQDRSFSINGGSSINELSNNGILNSSGASFAENQPINKDQRLKTEPAKTIEVTSARNWNRLNTFSQGTRFAANDYSESFSSKMSKTARALSRMFDNPIALKNLKDPSFLIPGLSSADVNFGNTGTLPATRVQTLSRLQWPGKENQQMINQLAIDGYVYAVRGGIGVQMNNSYYGEGEIMNNNVAVTYSPKLSVNRNILIEPSIRLKMGNKNLNANKIDGFGVSEMDRGNVFEFYPNGTVPSGRQLWYRDLGLGLMVNTKWFFAGLQGDNLFRHYDNIYSGIGASERRVDQHFIATIGTDYESKREMIGLSPYLVYQQSENLKELWMGLNTRVGWFTIGAAVSDRLDLAGSIGLKFNRFSLSYQADYAESMIWNKQLLSHQINLKYITFNPNKRQKILNL